jgi:REP element-mobilizing transposase RayT
MRFTPRKSSPRLPTFEYKGVFGYFVTTNTCDRLPVLRGDVAQRCVDVMLESASETEFEVMAYCVMPDHVHLLAQGLDESSNLIRFVQRLKQVTGFEFKKAIGSPLWHRSYYDHVLRNEDDVHDVAAYIWHNPVKAGLVTSATDYPFSGPPVYLGASSLDRAEALSVRTDASRWDESHDAR